MSALSRTYYIVALSILFVIQACTTFQRAQPDLPEGFSYLSDIDATIIQSPRYIGSENFLGRPIPGYVSKRVVCTTNAAQVLALAQKDLLAKGFSLVVYDAYRPQRAVDEFMRWSTDAADEVAKAKYYPTIDKKDVFKLGYVAEKSGHSRGSTLDLTLIEIGKSIKPVEVSSKMLKDGSIIPFLDDGTLDMGASFDLFHQASHHDTPLIEDIYTERRNFLRFVMKTHGFKEYAEEWWHYTLANEPFVETYFDFVPR